MTLILALYYTCRQSLPALHRYSTLQIGQSTDVCLMPIQFYQLATVARSERPTAVADKLGDGLGGQNYSPRCRPRSEGKRAKQTKESEPLQSGIHATSIQTYSHGERACVEISAIFVNVSHVTGTGKGHHSKGRLVGCLCIRISDKALSEWTCWRPAKFKSHFRDRQLARRRQRDPHHRRRHHHQPRGQNGTATEMGNNSAAAAAGERAWMPSLGRANDECISGHFFTFWVWQ